LNPEVVVRTETSNEKAFRATRTQLAPLSLHDVLQVTSLPFMQTLQTSTH